MSWQDAFDAEWAAISKLPPEQQAAAYDAFAKKYGVNLSVGGQDYNYNNPSSIGNVIDKLVKVGGAAAGAATAVYAPWLYPAMGALSGLTGFGQSKYGDQYTVSGAAPTYGSIPYGSPAQWGPLLEQAYGAGQPPRGVQAAVAPPRPAVNAPTARPTAHPFYESAQMPTAAPTAMTAATPAAPRTEMSYSPPYAGPNASDYNIPFGSSGGGSFDWMSLIPAALSFGQNYLQGQSQQQNARKATQASAQQRAETLSYASPANYMSMYASLAPAYFASYMPGLRSAGESLALGEQTSLQGFDADLARRGLSGSGMALAGRSAIRTGRQANYNQALRDYYMKAFESARDTAGRTQSGQISASLGAPVPYYPSPSSASNIANALYGGMQDYSYYRSQ